MRTKISKSIISAMLLCLISIIVLAGCSSNSYYINPTKTYANADDLIFTKGWSTDNNGEEKYGSEIDRLTAVKPNDAQMKFHELEYYNFIHFGMNTMTGAEWGTGKEDPSLFNPQSLNTDQWCETLKASGSKGIIFTAKHHDGFCLWQTETTEHSIKNSPYKNGQGDIVAELAASCKKYGLGLGIYLSPWDMNAPSYGHNSYNEFYLRQLDELTTNYGDLFAIWMDGARAQDVPLDPDFEYDMDAYCELIRKNQPDCIIANQGPDVRWVGNEAGVARPSEWNVVSKGKDPNLSQMSPEDAERLQAVKYDDTDTGSRAVLKNYANLRWYPAEVDVSIRNGWFYHKNEKPKSLKKLLNIYYKSVGANSSLLLNVPPNKDGLIDEKDVKRLKEFGDAISKTTSSNINYSATALTIDGGRITDGLSNLAIDTSASNYKLPDNVNILEFNFNEAHKIGRIDIRENLADSQRVEAYDIWFKTKGKWRLISSNTNIGNRRTTLINPSKLISTDAVRIVIRQSRGNPNLRSVSFYDYVK